MQTTPDRTLRLGTRGSLLARVQSEWVARRLEAAHPGLRVELHVIKTTGDRVQDRLLADLGGKGLFTKEIEQAVLAGEVDFAVHSYKDVPVTMPLVDVSTLAIVAAPAREDPRDVLVFEGAGAHADAAAALPAGARVGTGSLRRRVQLLHARPDLEVVPIRGNIDTRLRKWRDREVDAVVLAAAGLRRAGLFDDRHMAAVSTHVMVPAAGQGALALQCRAADHETVVALSALDDPATAACVAAERAVVLHLGADCHSPVGVFAKLVGGRLVLRASVGSSDGTVPPIVTQVEGEPGRAAELAKRVADAVARPATRPTA